MNPRAWRGAVLGGAGAVLASVVLLAGCTGAPEREAVEPPTVAAAAPATGVEVTPAPGPVVAGGEADAPDGSVYEAYPGTGEFVDPAAARRPDDELAEAGEIIFNFEGESLPEVVKAILGDLLQENYVIGPGIQGNVTFSTAKPVPMDQVMPILEMLLSWNNATLVYQDGRYLVLPINRAIPGQLRPVIDGPQGQRGYEVRAFPLEYIAPTEMEKLLRPYARETAFVNVDNLRGLLVLAGTAEELANYEQTIDIFDVDWLAGMSVGIYPLQRVDADTVVGELETVFGEGAGTPLAGMFRFMPIERLNAVMVITPQPEYLEAAAEWVERLDRGGSQAGTRLYVYDVKNVKAVDLADTLNEVFGGGGSAGREGTGRGRSNQLAPGLEAGEITSINDPRRREQQERTETAERPPAATGRAAGEGLTLVEGEEIRITAVEEANSLLIRATPPQYEAVLGAIRRLDTVPLQVLVEVKVLEVTLNENLRYGVSWFFEQAIEDFPLRPDNGGGDGNAGARSVFSSGSSVSSDRAGTISGTAGARYAILGGDAGAVITALETQTDVRTIAAPSMMVLNNREANINVGTQIPVNSPIFNTGTGQNLAQSRVQFRDTGVTLNVTPRVNPGGMVFMEIQQEVSSPIGTADANGNVSVNQRRLDTEIAVKSGETIVLGGLIQADLQNSRSGFPFLSQVPVIGGLFGNQGNDVTRTELLALITPMVVTSVDQARAVSDEYRTKMRALRPFDLQNVDVRRARKPTETRED